MINKEVLMKYTRLVNEYISNPAFVFSEEEKNIINLVNKVAREDEKLAKLLEELRNASDKNAVIEKYFNPNQSGKLDENVEEVIADTFGIDVSKIEHKYLNNGKEIFSFYDVNAGRNILLENYKKGTSLVEQLKEVQAQSSSYQTSNDEKNAEDILKDKILKENCELSMIPIEEVVEKLKEVSGLSLEDYYKILFLYKNADAIDISYINFENVIGLDKNGKIYEVYKDSSYEYQIGEPNTAIYNEEKINVSDRVDENYTNSEQNMALQSNYEDIPDEVEYVSEDNELKFDDLPEDIQETTKMLYENPKLLDQVSEEIRQYWLKNIELYKKKLELEENERNRQQNMPKVKQLVKEKEGISNNGYINFVNLTFIFGLIFTVISMIIVLVS